MTIKKLIEQLEEFPDDREILLASDPEGNHFRRLEGFGTSMYREDGRILEVYNEEDLEPEDIKSGNYKKCLIIWP